MSDEQRPRLIRGSGGGFLGSPVMIDRSAGVVTVEVQGAAGGSGRGSGLPRDPWQVLIDRLEVRIDLACGGGPSECAEFGQDVECHGLYKHGLEVALDVARECRALAQNDENAPQPEG